MQKYSKEFKAEALKLSDEIGIKKASAQLGVSGRIKNVQVKAFAKSAYVI